MLFSLHTRIAMLLASAIILTRLINVIELLFDKLIGKDTHTDYQRVIHFMRPLLELASLLLL